MERVSLVASLSLQQPFVVVVVLVHSSSPFPRALSTSPSCVGPTALWLQLFTLTLTMPLSTASKAFCAHFRCSLPLVCPPMAAVAGGVLAAEVHQAGGVGFIGGVSRFAQGVGTVGILTDLLQGHTPLENLKQEVQKARETLSLPPDADLPCVALLVPPVFPKLTSPRLQHRHRLDPLAPRRTAPLDLARPVRTRHLAPLHPPRGARLRRVAVFHEWEFGGVGQEGEEGGEGGREEGEGEGRCDGADGEGGEGVACD